uniref:Prospero domain-containing protein n=2 Tax=Mesocestoides corti TaxID=53468 RepID=A0A5K3FDE9_MESCO
MNLAQTVAQHYNCQLQKWLKAEHTSARTNAPPTSVIEKPASEEGGERRFTCSPSASDSPVEAPKPTTPPRKESPLKVAEGASRSYSMEDLLRSDSSNGPEVVRWEKQKSPVSTTTTTTPEASKGPEGKKRPHEEFLAELSRTATDALTRALSKRPKLVESGLGQELEGLIREAIETSIDRCSSFRAESDEQRSQPDESHRVPDLPDVEKAEPLPQHNSSLSFPSYVPLPTEIMGAMGGHIHEVFGQSFSAYYKAACRVLQTQERLIPHPPSMLFGSSKLPELNTSPRLEGSRLEPYVEFQKMSPNHIAGTDQPNHQTEALALVVNRNRGSALSPSFDQPHESLQSYENPLVSCGPRRKRTKVTDTRLVPPKMPPQLPMASMESGSPFVMPETPRSKTGEVLPRIPPPQPPPPHVPLNFDPALVSDILKSLSMSNGYHHPPCSTFDTRGPLLMPPGRLPSIDLLGNLPPPPHPHHPPAFCYDLPTASPVVDSTPIRRNRSIGGKRVTNASTLTYGCDARSFLSSSSASDDGNTGLHSGSLGNTVATTSTLTPIHLRKAKLMFFFTRYPNSSLLKVFFSDVKFNKNNTAQLVKWFSNFREFYYIQMEKYARVAISEGIRSPNDITVTANSELYRTLALHYNRNQQIEIPEYFRVVVETTMREFFVALSTGKDSEQSWKKPIYKIIARMDQPVPEYFKDPNWMAQLADG